MRLLVALVATLAGPGSEFHFASQSELRHRLMAAGTAFRIAIRPQLTTP